MRRFPAGRWGLFAATAILTAGLLLSCPSSVSPEIEAPDGGEEATPDDLGLPTFDPSVDTLAATGIIYGETDGLTSGSTGAPDHIILDRLGERVLAAAIVDSGPDALHYLPFGDAAWQQISVSPNADDILALGCDEIGLYAGDGPDVLVIPPGATSADTEGVFPDGTTTTAVYAAGEFLFLGTTEKAFRVPASEIGSATAIDPEQISDPEAVYPYHVTSFAETETVVYVGAVPALKEKQQGGLYSWNPVPGAKMPWQTVSTDVAVNDLVALSGTLYVGARAGLFLLTSASTLDPVAELAHPDTGQPVVHDLFADNGVIYAATSHGLWYSPDGGTAWVLLEPGDLAPNLATTTISSITALGDRVYLGVDAYGVVELRWQ